MHWSAVPIVAFLFASRSRSPSDVSTASAPSPPPSRSLLRTSDDVGSLASSSSSLETENGRGPVSSSSSPFKLSARLRRAFDACAAAASFRSPSSSSFVVADVGCDHATLAAALAREGVADRVVAVDRAPGPLARGRETARAASVENVVEFRSGDGTAPLSPDDGVDVVCVVGLGARTIVEVLSGGGDDEDDAPRSLGVRHLVLQPVDPRPTYVAALRRWLRDHGWTITNETILRNDDGRRRRRRRRSKGASSSSSSSSFYLTLLASDTRRDDVDATTTTSLDEDLVLPASIRDRTSSLSIDRDDELATYRSYVNKYAEWASSGARHDTYDGYDGAIPTERLAEVLSAEKGRLDRLLS